MKILSKIVSFAALAFGAVACTNEIAETQQRPEERVEVGFSLPADGTRTTIGDDGRTTEWVVGDKLAVWAKDANGSFTFENTVFSLRHFSETYDKAFFTASIAAMAEGDYTYLLAYPRPNAVNGTLATYSVASTQSGKYDGIHDIMIAEPVTAGALTTGGMVTLNTVMRHQMHAIKITIPEGRNLYGSRFYRLEITFPEDVVGDVTFDLSDLEEAPVYYNTSNQVVVESAEGFDAGDDIWIFVLPGTVDGDVSYRVRGELRHSNVSTYGLTREMKAGHVTPIRMAIPEIYPYFTAVSFHIDQNNLGEDFNYFDVYDANGTHMGRFERNSNNKYTVYYEGEFDADQYDNSSWRIVFDSKHATVETTINLGDLTDYTEHTHWMNVPYLFAEDFTALAKFDNEYTEGPYTSTDGATSPGVDHTQYGLASGWTGARTGCDAAGTSILVSGRVDCVIAGATRAYGRLDSPAMSNLKADAVVNVKVTFDYGGSRSGTSTYYPVGRVGYTTTQGAISGYATQFNNNPSFTNIDGAAEVPNIPTSGSATSLTQSMTYNITDCTPSHRISWHVGHMGYKSWRIDNGYGWMYVDNVKVQIAE